MRFFFFFIFIINQVQAFEFLTKWNDELNQELIINCNEGEYLCYQVCRQDSQCRIPQPYCQNCIGTSPILGILFQSLNMNYSRAFAKVDVKKFIALLNSGHFVSFDGNTPYNIFDPINSLKFSNELDKLCGQSLSQAIILGQLREDYKIKSFEYLICHAEDGHAMVYQLKQLPEINQMLSQIQ
ncbi:MAG: hypothetical protein AB7I27_14275 [Bacteriovoracaceae bacterium]